MEELDSIQQAIHNLESRSVESSEPEASKADVELTMCQEENARLREDLKREKQSHDVAGCSALARRKP